MSEGRWRIPVPAPDWGQDHLSLDAIVAYVDDELAAGPHLRATRHLARCSDCASQVVAQGQARAALRTAGCPSLPSSLLSSLRAIPQDADLPGPPPGLAVTADGQLVSVLRPDRTGAITPETRSPLADEPPAGTDGSHNAHSTPHGTHGRRPQRRLRVGTGVAVSGLALGAIAFAVPSAVPSSDPQPPVPAASNGPLGGSVLGSTSGVVDAQLRLPRAVPGTTAGAAPLPALGDLDAMPSSFYGPMP